MRVLLVATVQSHICQFHKPLVSMLHEHGCEVHVAARNNLAEKNGLALDFVDQVFDLPFERSPFSGKNVVAYQDLKRIIARGGYDVVHTNTPVGGMVGRLAARKARKSGCKVFYTAHGFHFFQGGPKKSWIFYYPLERLMCRYTDELITVNEEDERLARKKFRVCVSRIHGVGADSGRYAAVSERQCAELRKSLGFSSAQKLLLCTGELNANKNQITAIRAMQQVVERHPEAVLLLAGNGPAYGALQEAVRALELREHVVLLGYRTDLQRYVKAADLIVSCSRREGLPLNLVEGMLCEKAVIASVNRGHQELIRDGVNGYLVPADDVAGFAGRIEELFHDEERRHAFGKRGRELAQAYTDRAVARELEEIYRKSNMI